VATTLTYDTFGAVLDSPDSRLTWLAQQYGGRIAQGINRVTRGSLSPEDLWDVYQETLCESWKRVRDKNIPAEEYLPMMRAIAYCNGLDELRRRRKRPLTNLGEALYTIEDPRHCSGRGSWWQRMGQAEREEFGAALLDAVAELPLRQRLVAEVFLKHYQEFGERATHGRLTELVSAVTEQPENVVTVKSLWHTAKRTIAAALRRRGYDVTEETGL
jgi:DNA-directed RNA polymerase specialized sigma24 family protein